MVAIDNPDLDPESPDDYIGVNIFPYYFLSDKTQATAQNYICFETSFKLRLTPFLFKTVARDAGPQL